jgi:hypothetical protein
MKLFPILAILMAHTFTSQYMEKMYYKMVDEIALGDYSSMDFNHHITAAGKAILTQDC